jgi:hypothetical protein
MTFGERIGAAFRAFFSLLSSGTLPPDVSDALERQAGPATSLSTTPPVVAAAPAPAAVERAVGTPEDGAVQLLALLQRDARLLDFLMGDLAGYADAHVGAAVREVHAGARKVLRQYLEIEPVLDGAEDQPVTLPAVDPSEVKLVGRVSGQPPVRGTLRHRGWRSARVQLPGLPPAGARLVIAPAEVEVA